MVDLEVTESGLMDTEVNPRTLLAVLWICHFLLWTFGDMLSLLQETVDPITSSLIEFVAPTTAIVQALVIAFCLVGRPIYVRRASLIVAPVYLLFNIGFFFDAAHGWEYYLGVFYVLFNLLILWRAYTWPSTR